MKVLVTGAAGFIGSHLARALVDHGEDVVALDRRPFVVPGARVMIDDLVRCKLPSVDVIFHLAGRPGVRQSWDQFDVYLRDNLLATQRVLEHAWATGARLVFASSSSVYGLPTERPTPISPYGVSKLAVENLARAYHETHDVHSIALRYFTVYGPGQRSDMAFHRFITATLRGEPIEVYGDGTQTRNFTYVSDAVDATLIAATALPGAYDVPGAGAASVHDAIGLIGTLTGEPVTVKYQGVAAGDPHSIEPRGTLPGYAPRVELYDGLAMQVESLRVRAAA